MRLFALRPLLPFAIIAAALPLGCGGKDSSLPLGDAGDDGSVGDDSSLPGDDGGLFDIGGTDPDAATLQITPADYVLDIDTAATTPSTVAYKATLGGRSVGAVWSIDRGELGVIGTSSGIFTPGGTIGGKTKVTASYGTKTATTTLTVHLHTTMLGGGASGGDAGVGAGGFGGVGGEGVGGVPSATVVGAFAGTPTADASLQLVYPYDKTVWPRGILAPLMQWRSSNDYDAVRIHLKEDAYEFTGTFARTATPFSHHPIPQDVWKTLSYSNAGEPVAVELSFVKGTTLYGKATQSWTIASGALPGVIYYQSYGTNLTHYNIFAKNGAKFGAATLAIKGGSDSPSLIAGSDTACRVCHSVSADGSSLVTQTGENYSQSVHVALGGGLTETVLGPPDNRFEFGGLTPDGKSILTGQGAGANLGLYDLPGGGAHATTGLPSGLVPGTPAWSPDGKHVAFNYVPGTGGDDKSLALLDFASAAFSGPKTIFTPPSGAAVWPSWFPTNDGLIFELETVNNGRDYAGTRSKCDDTSFVDPCGDQGTHGELWWLDIASGKASRLDMANGLGYMPKGDGTTGSGHDDDSTLQYEPTVNPVVSGGYIWVVFTSRRLYGNVATVNPYWSDPRWRDISTTPTTKKLWVAAIDLTRTPGKDPSHPAFYLPGQELLAGNSRGFWVVDPCKKEGSSCLTGDECCDGYCETPTGAEAGAGRVCTKTVPTCAAEYDKCTKDTDCCDNPTVKCIGGRCAATTIPK